MIGNLRLSPSTTALATNLLSFTRFSIGCGATYLPPAVLIRSFLRSVIFRRSEEHTSELQSRLHLVCRLLLEKKKKMQTRARESRAGTLAHKRHADPSPRKTEGNANGAEESVTRLTIYPSLCPIILSHCGRCR